MLEPALPSLDARTSLTLSTPDARTLARCSNPRSMLEPSLDARTLARCSNQPYPLDASLDARSRALDISSALLIRVRVPASSSNRDVALNLYRTFVTSYNDPTRERISHFLASVWAIHCESSSLNYKVYPQAA